ncbi:ABC transporter permease [Corallincola platygyrae]|uniref:ABC transporter permease n=1 Tax=Corallincola platygyrae TaxID=1193278 RepID=A0ABW4XVD9_9GAMM
MQQVIAISWLQLAGFSLILLLPLVLNAWLKLGLAKESALAIARMSIQLVLVGLYLEFLFKLNSLWLNLLWLTVMLLVGSEAIISKAKLPYRALFMPVTLGLLIGLSPLLIILLTTLLQPSPTYSAQYLIPLAGMLLGNSLSGNIVALQRLFTGLAERVHEYEGALVLGATPKQASFTFVQSALKQSLAPILASMATTGMVTLPGMMTGQILGGTDPMLAVKYQWVILLAIFVMLWLSVTVSLLLAVKLLITPTGLVNPSAMKAYRQNEE